VATVTVEGKQNDSNLQDLMTPRVKARRFSVDNGRDIPLGPELSQLLQHTPAGVVQREAHNVDAS